MKLTELGIKALEKNNKPNSKRIFWYIKYFANEIETVEELLNKETLSCRYSMAHRG